VVVPADAALKIVGLYRRGETCQFDVWQPREEMPVGDALGGPFC
jgi:hypothetical protein